MSNVHVLPDENLGGGPNGQVLREYVEVERRAKVGEKIVIVRPEKGSAYEKGDIFTVVKSYKNHPEYEDGVEVEEDFYFIYHSEYHTLEPTDIVHIPSEQGNVQRYRLVDRKAKVGDKFINKAGEVYEVDTESMQSLLNRGEHFFRVLEPVEPAQADSELVTAEEGDNKSVLDLLANLAHRLTTLEQQVARRVTELERKLEREQEFRESLYRKISDMKDDIEMALDDIVTLDERTQPLVALAKAVKGDE
jgi:hypothetical protein